MNERKKERKDKMKIRSDAPELKLNLYELSGKRVKQRSARGQSIS